MKRSTLFFPFFFSFLIQIFWLKTQGITYSGIQTISPSNQFPYYLSLQTNLSTTLYAQISQKQQLIRKSHFRKSRYDAKNPPNTHIYASIICRNLDTGDWPSSWGRRSNRFCWQYNATRLCGQPLQNQFERVAVSLEFVSWKFPSYFCLLLNPFFLLFWFWFCSIYNSLIFYTGRVLS